MKSLDPLRAKIIFIRKKLGHTSLRSTSVHKVIKSEVYQCYLDYHRNILRHTIGIW